MEMKFIFDFFAWLGIIHHILKIRYPKDVLDILDLEKIVVRLLKHGKIVHVLLYFLGIWFLMYFFTLIQISIIFIISSCDFFIGATDSWSSLIPKMQDDKETGFNVTTPVVQWLGLF